MDETPILDNHLHLRPSTGSGINAVRDFVAAGGTHMLIVNNPSWYSGSLPESGADFRSGFDETVGVVDAATTILPGRAYAVLGVHPALISQLIESGGLSPSDAESLMCAGIDVAAEYVAAGRAVALKSGRPHYPVDAAVEKASNHVLQHAIQRASDLEVALQLHTESSEDLSDIIEWATERGLESNRVVKHFASGKLTGPIPSVISRRSALEAIAAAQQPFLMETDFLDDPDRPGAVLGPKVIPKRTAWLRDEGYDDAVRTAHVETPKLVYGIDTESTLS